MFDSPHHLVLDRQKWTWPIVGMVMVGALVFGRDASAHWLMFLTLGFVTVALLHAPQLGLTGLITAALVLPFKIRTGTEVTLNIATLLVPALFAWWLVHTLLKREWRWATSRVNRPLTLFLLAGLLSLLLGNVLWDPAIPKSGHFWLVQLAQWAIFAFAALAFWLTANMIRSEEWLKRLTWTFLYLGGGLAILWVLPGVGRIANSTTTVAMIRAPFWVLLTALAGGLLLFDGSLSRVQRVYLIAVLGAALAYAFIQQREAASNWVGLAAVAGVLVWQRFPRLRGVIVALALLLSVTGVLFPSLYEFAGGDDEWTESGGSRLVLIGRVLEVTMRNPITGLGPASYRPYASIEPLRYGRALWLNPKVNSHNNYVDIFAHTGLLGLSLFLWFAVELGLLGLRLSTRYRERFVGGYVNGVLAAWAASLILMLLADWILPFVYNIGFGGFQASLLVWLFLGGLVTVEQWDKEALDA